MSVIRDPGIRYLDTNVLKSKLLESLETQSIKNSYFGNFFENSMAHTKYIIISVSLITALMFDVNGFVPSHSAIV